MKFIKSAKGLIRNPQYWPPSKHSPITLLPDGRKKMFVFNGKSDRDGSLQPTLCIATVRGNHRLAFFDEEELDELIRVSDRVQEYVSLWEKKAEMNKIKSDEIQRRQIASNEPLEY